MKDHQRRVRLTPIFWFRCKCLEWGGRESTTIQTHGKYTPCDLNRRLYFRVIYLRLGSPFIKLNYFQPLVALGVITTANKSTIQKHVYKSFPRLSENLTLYVYRNVPSQRRQGPRNVTGSIDLENLSVPYGDRILWTHKNEVERERTEYSSPKDS